MLLLDQGLPRSTVRHLLALSIEATHVGEIGLSSATDSELLSYAQQRGWIIVTLDADFHMLMALSGASGPSVIRLRVEGLRGEELANILGDLLRRCGDELQNGAVATVTEAGVRIRRLPLP